MSKETCRCGRGKVSAHDGKCGHCRTKRDRQLLDEKFKEQERIDTMLPPVSDNRSEP